MGVVSQLLILGIKHREGKMSHMPVLADDAGPFHFIPVVDGPIRIAHKVLRRVVGQSPERPVGDAIG